MIKESAACDLQALTQPPVFQWCRFSRAETLSSSHSAAQGLLGDRILSDRRTVLLVSFFGAATSYAMVGAATSIWTLLASRIVVGLVKQVRLLKSGFPFAPACSPLLEMKARHPSVLPNPGRVPFA